MKRNMTDIQKFIKLMNDFGIESYETKDEYDCTEVRIKNSHHNSVPLFYFDESGKFIEVKTAIANSQCNVCGAIEIYNPK